MHVLSSAIISLDMLVGSSHREQESSKCNLVIKHHDERELFRKQTKFQRILYWQEDYRSLLAIRREFLSVKSTTIKLKVLWL